MPNGLIIKKELFVQCLEYCKIKHEGIHFQIEEIVKALTMETKSSAGDKHETGRAMLHLEREKLGNQLAQVQKLQETLSRIQIEKTSKTIGLGSVVYTSQANYFIAISAGQFQIDNVVFYAISAQTPIGKLLIGKKLGDEISYREMKFIIKKTI